MVNVLKRMRGLQPLHSIRHGPGAAILPPPPAPQLSRVILKYNPKLHNSDSIAVKTFWKKHLTRLKYYNPGLPIEVVTAQFLRLELRFESPDQRALKALERAATLEESPKAEAIEDPEGRLVWSNVETKVSTAKVEGAPEGSTDSTAPPVFTRNVSRSLLFTRYTQVWQWFQQLTKCTDVPENPEETQKMKELVQFFNKAELDRQRVKAGRDAMKKQQQDLKNAREAAERMANEL